MAEWLRRLTRNQIPSGSAGSNPADCADYLLHPGSPYGDECGGESPKTEVYNVYKVYNIYKV